MIWAHYIYSYILLISLSPVYIHPGKEGWVCGVWHAGVGVGVDWRWVILSLSSGWRDLCTACLSPPVVSLQLGLSRSLALIAVLGLHISWSSHAVVSPSKTTVQPQSTNHGTGKIIFIFGGMIVVLSNVDFLFRFTRRKILLLVAIFHSSLLGHLGAFWFVFME